MARRMTYHVARNRAKAWQVRLAGSAGAISTHRTQAVAIDSARVLAKAQTLGQVKVHGVNGRIRTEFTYGADPRRYVS